MATAALLSAGALGMEAGAGLQTALLDSLPVLCGCCAEGQNDDALLAKHVRGAKTKKNLRRALAFVAGHAAGMAFLKLRRTDAAGPLALAAGAHLIMTAISLGLMERTDRQIAAAGPGASKALLVRYSRLQVLRTALAGVALGGALCGLLLAKRK